MHLYLFHVTFTQFYCNAHMQSLIEQLGRPGVNANGDTSNGDAPIHAIVKRKCKRKADCKEKVDLLLALLTHSDADVNLQNANGMTALHFTAEVNNNNI